MSASHPFWAEADAALATALSLDSTVARAWLAGSFIALVRDWDWAAAEIPADARAVQRA